MLRRKSRRSGPAASALVLALACAGAAAAADVEAGRAVFQVCSVCHSTRPDELNIGPTLFGVVGRKAGSLESFDYSPAMKAAMFTWTRTTLDAYLKDPANYVKGNKMTFVGLADARDRTDVIAYLGRLKAAR